MSSQARLNLDNAYALGMGAAVTEEWNPAWSLPLTVWGPQEGPQFYAYQAAGVINEVFFGGTRGGGKTDLLLGDQLRGACTYGPWWKGMIIRRKYKDFSSIRQRLDELIRMGLPAERVGGETQLGIVKFSNGALIYLQAIPRLGVAEDFQGLDFTRISIEEAPLLPFIGPLIDVLKGSLRSVHGVPTGFVLTGNPGGPGAGAIKLLFIDPAAPGEVVRELGTSRVFIKSRLDDNRILQLRDPDYANQLRSIKDPLLRRAWIDGDWDVFIGQAFMFHNAPPPEGHVIEPIWPVPEYAPLYMTFDWGYGKPFSIGWWWVDSAGTLLRCGEWYGWDGATPDVGLRLTDEQIAEGIIEREQGLGIAGRHNEIRRLAGPDCWSKKPDYQGGGQGPSTEEVFRQVGKRHNYNLQLRPGDPSRELKIRQFRSRLARQGPDNQPALLVYNTCRHFCRTIPALTMDELKPEDVDTEQEDHIYDEACHICMARPIALSDIEMREIERAKQRESRRQELDTASRVASRELETIEQMLKEYKEKTAMAGDVPQGGERVW